MPSTFQVAVPKRKDTQRVPFLWVRRTDLDIGVARFDKLEFDASYLFNKFYKIIIAKTI